MSEDLEVLCAYFEKWRLKVSWKKTVASMFHLNNREASREINITVASSRVKFEPNPTYLGVVLDRSLTFGPHLKQLAAKCNSRVALIRKLAGTHWGACAHTLRLSSLALVYSTAEYCSAIWDQSTHVRKLDTKLNSAMRIVTGCVESTPTECLPVPSGILPPPLRRELAVKNLAKKIKRDPSHIMHEMLSYDHHLRLTSRHPIYHHLQNASEDRSKPIDKWRHMWWVSKYNLKHYIEIPVVDLPPGAHLPRPAWCRLNRLRTGYGRFRSCLEKWGCIDDPTCTCGEAPQTAEHILSQCKTLKPPCGKESVVRLDPSTVQWLESELLDI